MQAQTEGIKAYADEKYSSLQSELDATKAALAVSSATAREREREDDNARLRVEADKLRSDHRSSSPQWSVIAMSLILQWQSVKMLRHQSMVPVCLFLHHQSR